MALEELTGELEAAVRGFEWARVETLCDGLARAIRSSQAGLPAHVVRSLSLLRRKRRFGCIERIAGAAIHIGEGPADIRRHYAQALIDQGLLVAAEHVLRETLAGAADSPELYEVQGLLGRVYKQWYVTAPAGTGRRQRETLQQAVDWYLTAYRASPRLNYWQGINVVALAARGERDGIAVPLDQAPAALAGEIVAALDGAGRARAGPAPVWEVATLMEAFLALGRADAMFERAQEYAAHPDADVFEVGSTLRQLVEVWNLTDDDPPGSAVLPLLRGKLLREDGGSLTFTPRALARERARTSQSRLIHGADGLQTLQWYRRGLDCCEAVARIETEGGRGIGTGWLVRAADCVPSAGDELLLVTNAHVISPADRPYRGALLPSEAVANFQLIEKRVGVGEVLWSSPVDSLDCTVLRLKARPAARPLTLSSFPVKMAAPPPRMYMIGHPGGRDVEFSLQDNHLVGCNDRLLHYRTPTEGGSSGSPVFNASWEVVALHHAGSTTLPRIDGVAGTYEANEGIALSALLSAVNGTAVVVVSAPAPLGGVVTQAQPVAPSEPFVEARPADYVDRAGYDPSFLGINVPLPTLVDPADVLTFDWNDRDECELRYEHFSVVMSRSRRLCFFSAVNIDAREPRRLKRRAWRLDPRIPADRQIRDECYGAAPRFSRGHMTRREDPIWGPLDSAALGNEDSMHVTNTVPQMQPFNAGVWLGLEDYALEHAREDDMRISVFTGPFLQEDDPTRYGVRVPRSFWKVIVFVHDGTRELCATGYTMSQEEFLREAEFVYGQHHTYQTPIAAIERRAGMLFGELPSLDPLRGTEESAAAPLTDYAQIVWSG